MEPAPVRAETLPDALVRTYQGNPQLNAERARLRGTDEGVPQALSGYRPQLLATLTGGLQQVRNLLPDNTIQTATLHTWSIGFTVTQTLFNGFKTANTVRQSEAQVLSGREALRNTGQGLLLDAVTAYTNVRRIAALSRAADSDLAAAAVGTENMNSRKASNFAKAGSTTGTKECSRPARD
jgi:outer membrane protein